MINITEPWSDLDPSLRLHYFFFLALAVKSVLSRFLSLYLSSLLLPSPSLPKLLCQGKSPYKSQPLR